MLEVIWEDLRDALPIVDKPEQGDVWTWEKGKAVKAHIGSRIAILPVEPFPIPLPDMFRSTPYEFVQRRKQDVIAEKLARLANAAGWAGDFRVLERYLNWQPHGRLPTLYAAIAMIPDEYGEPPTQRISYVVNSHLKDELKWKP